MGDGSGGDWPLRYLMVLGVPHGPWHVKCRGTYKEPQNHTFSFGVTLCRRLFYLFSYFVFFQNMVVGFVSSLLRIICSVLLGLVLFFRLDRVVLMKGFEALDQGRPLC